MPSNKVQPACALLPGATWPNVLRCHSFCEPLVFSLTRESTEQSPQASSNSVPPYPSQGPKPRLEKKALYHWPALLCIHAAMAVNNKCTSAFRPAAAICLKAKPVASTSSLGCLGKAFSAMLRSMRSRSHAVRTPADFAPRVYCLLNQRSSQAPNQESACSMCFRLVISMTTCTPQCGLPSVCRSALFSMASHSSCCHGTCRKVIRNGETLPGQVRTLERRLP